MKITPEFDDASDFVTKVEQAVNGIIRRHAPEAIFLIKIDNFFGSKWLGFSGKFMGALGSWNKPYDKPADDIRIPPSYLTGLCHKGDLPLPPTKKSTCASLSTN